MKVLVTVASKHGSTRELGEAIAEVLTASGVDVDVIPPSPDMRVADYAAIVCGSAVYGGSWRKEAVSFLEERADDLRNLPVWLFSTGPVGEADLEDESNDGNRLASLVGARGHTTFGGKLDMSQLTMGERAIVKLVRAPEGDYRDFDAARAWARHIAETIGASTN